VYGARCLQYCDSGFKSYSRLGCTYKTVFFFDVLPCKDTYVPMGPFFITYLMMNVFEVILEINVSGHNKWQLKK
jgi:hypothetical protein